MPKRFSNVGEFPRGNFGRADPMAPPGKIASDPRTRAKVPKPEPMPGDAPLNEPDLEARDIRPQAISGGVRDALRVRAIKQYYSEVIDQQRITFSDWNTQRNYSPVINTETIIDSFSVAEARFLYLDNIEFYATSLITGTYVLPGQIEGVVQFYLKIGDRIPLDIRVRKLDVTQATGAYFPFVNDRVGPTETKFNLIARTGESVQASYISIAPPGVPLGVVGVRLRGWVGDDIIIKEILEQQT